MRLCVALYCYPYDALANAAARNFKLLDELEEAEKSAKGGADISLGLQRADDTVRRLLLALASSVMWPVGQYIVQ